MFRDSRLGSTESWDEVFAWVKDNHLHQVKIKGAATRKKRGEEQTGEKRCESVGA